MSLIKLDKYKREFNFLLNTIFPEDNKLGTPGLANLNFFDYIKKYNKVDTAFNLLEVSQLFAQEEFSKDLSELDSNELNQLFKITKRKEFKLFNDFTVLCTECFYNSPKIREKLQIPLVAPFPDGNNVDDIDFTMLEKVYLKGKIFREVK